MGKDLKGKEIGRGLCQERSGRYKARFTDKTGLRQSKRFDTLNEAKLWLSEQEYLDRHSNRMCPTSLILDAWYDSWIKGKTRTVREGTLQVYRRSYDTHIRPLLGRMKLVDIKVYHCQQVVETMADAGLHSSTIDTARRVLKSLLDDAVENQIISASPCGKSVKSSIGKPPRKRDALTRDQQRALLTSAQSDEYGIQFVFLIQTGVRISELTALRWEDVDLSKRVIHIRRSMRYDSGRWIVGPTKSKSGERIIPLSDEAVRILERQRAFDRKMKVVGIEWGDLVFLNKKGRPISDHVYNAHLAKVCKSAGIPRCSVHILRHTFATRCIEAGLSVKTLQTVMGHASITITMNRYVHSMEDQIISEMHSISDRLSV